MDEEEEGEGTGVPKKKAALVLTWQLKLFSVANAYKACKKARIASKCKRKTSKTCMHYNWLKTRCSLMQGRCGAQKLIRNSIVVKVTKSKWTHLAVKSFTNFITGGGPAQTLAKASPSKGVALLIKVDKDEDEDDDVEEAEPMPVKSKRKKCTVARKLVEKLAIQKT